MTFLSWSQLGLKVLVPHSMKQLDFIKLHGYQLSFFACFVCGEEQGSLWCGAIRELGPPGYQHNCYHSHRSTLHIFLPQVLPVFLSQFVSIFLYQISSIFLTQMLKFQAISIIATTVTGQLSAYVFPKCFTFVNQFGYSILKCFFGLNIRRFILIQN